MKSSPVVERRIFARRPLQTKVVFEDEYGEGLFFVYSKDISMGGIFLDSSIPVKLGTLLFLSLALPPYKRPIHVTGEVVRVVESKTDKIAGMGIRFVGLSGSAQEKLDKFFSST